MYRKILLIACLCLAVEATNAQKTLSEQSIISNEFFNFQLQFSKVKRAYDQYYQRLKSEFQEVNVRFPADEIYIRAFKKNKIMEVWVKPQQQDTFLLYKSFRICGSSGVLGPKRREGDLQVPEGAYFIEEFNPKSNYFLSLLINYPNYSDLKNTSSADPGGDIYLHGSCSTVGCIPIDNEGIMELYLLCMIAKSNGQQSIPVHIFPFRFDEGGLLFLGENLKDNQSKIKYWSELKELYDYFDHYRRLPVIMYDENGNYLVERID